MTKWFLSFVICFSALTLQAHQPDISSTLLVEQADNKWVLQIRTALTALDYEIKAKYPTKPYESAEEFQALVLQHVRENLQIIFNNQDKVALQNGLVKLGHESSITFEVVGVPKTQDAIFVKNSSFKTIRRNQSALILMKKGMEKNQFILNEQNQHSVSLRVKGNQFISAKTTEVLPSKINSTYTYGGILLLFVGIFGFMLWSRFNN